MGVEATRRPTVRMTPLVIAWRTGHGLIAVGFLAAIGYVWACAIRGCRGPLLAPAVGALAAEGALVVATGGTARWAGWASASATRSRCSSWC